MGHHSPGLRLSGIFLKTISVREPANALKKRGLKKVGFRVFSSHWHESKLKYTKFALHGIRVCHNSIVNFSMFTFLII